MNYPLYVFGRRVYACERTAAGHTVRWLLSTDQVLMRGRGYPHTQGCVDIRLWDKASFDLWYDRAAPAYTRCDIGGHLFSCSCARAPLPTAISH